MPQLDGYIGGYLVILIMLQLLVLFGLFSSIAMESNVRELAGDGMKVVRQCWTVFEQLISNFCITGWRSCSYRSKHASLKTGCHTLLQAFSALILTYRAIMCEDFLDFQLQPTF